MKALNLPLIIAASLLSTSSHAAQYCITAETALVSALTIATSSAEDDEIRFVKGLLNINVNLTHYKLAAARDLSLFVRPLTYFPGQPQA